MKELLEHLFRFGGTQRQALAPEHPITILERYHVDAVLGRGGTAFVVSAQDSKLRRRVAIKIWRPCVDAVDGLRANSVGFFEREAQVLASLKHPGLCEIYDFGVYDGLLPWMVLEECGGQTLRALIEDWRGRRGKHDVRRVLSIARQAAETVAFLHDSGLCQLDIKPENILVNAGDSVKIVDIATCLERPTRDFRIEVGRYGTPGYAAPEVVSDAPRASCRASEEPGVTAAADVFSLGICFLELCCLDNPLGAEELRGPAYEALDIHDRHAIDDYTTAAFDPSRHARVRDWGKTYLRELASVDFAALLRAAPIQLPLSLRELIVRMVAVAPNQRPSDAARVAQSLQRVESDGLRCLLETAEEHAMLWIHEAALLDALEKSRSTLYNWRKKSGFPAPVDGNHYLPDVSRWCRDNSKLLRLDKLPQEIRDFIESLSHEVEVQRREDQWRELGKARPDDKRRE